MASRGTITLVVAASILLICIACRSNTTSPEGMLMFLMEEQNGLKKTAVVNDIKTEVMVKPTDLMVRQQIDGGTSTQEIDSLRGVFGDYAYFVLSLSKNNEEALQASMSNETYGEMVEVLSFRMAQFALLTTSLQDTIPVGDFIFDRTFGMKGANEVLLAFPSDKMKGSEWVQFNLKEFGLATGDQAFRFKMSDLANAPKLSFPEVE